MVFWVKQLWSAAGWCWLLRVSRSPVPTSLLHYFTSSGIMSAVGTEEVQVKCAAAGQALTGWRTTVPLLLFYSSSSFSLLPRLRLSSASRSVCCGRLCWMVNIRDRIIGTRERERKKQQLFTQLRWKVISTVLSSKWLIFHLEQSGIFPPFSYRVC